MPQTKTIILSAAAVAAIGGGGFAAYWFIFRDKGGNVPKPKYNKFEAYKMRDAQSRASGGGAGAAAVSADPHDACASVCSRDPSCTAFSINHQTQSCSTSTEDPLTTAVEDSGYVLYTKRAEGEDESAYTSWVPSDTCPTTCGPATVLTRQCTGAGKCPPGKTSIPCARKPCDTFEDFPAGYAVIDPEEKSENVDPTVHTDSKAACKQLCLGREDCTGVRWGEAAKECIVYKNFRPTGVKWVGTDVWSSDLSIRMPGDGQKWSPFDVAGSKNCKCGTVKGTRTCATAAQGKPCTAGISHYDCVKWDCAYNGFPGFRMP